MTGRRPELLPVGPPEADIPVVPPDLDSPTGVEVWRTMSSVPASSPLAEAARYDVNLIARSFWSNGLGPDGHEIGDGNTMVARSVGRSDRWDAGGGNRAH